jgi:hypothetical protein
LVLAYWEALERIGKGFDQTPFMLKVATLTSNPKLFVEEMRLYLGANYLNTWNCALEGFELFGSTKRILDLPHGSKLDSR